MTRAASSVDVPTAEGPRTPGYPPTLVDEGTDPMTSPAADGSEVRLLVPAQSRFLRLARLTAAGLAGDLGYSLDEIEDLRIAIDELSAVAIDGAAEGALLTICYREVDGSLHVQGSCPHPAAEPPELHVVARELLEMLADGYVIDGGGGVRTFELVKRTGVGTT